MDMDSRIQEAFQEGILSNCNPEDFKPLIDESMLSTLFDIRDIKDELATLERMGAGEANKDLERDFQRGMSLQKIMGLQYRTFKGCYYLLRMMLTIYEQSPDTIKESAASNSVVALEMAIAKRIQQLIPGAGAYLLQKNGSAGYSLEGDPDTEEVDAIQAYVGSQLEEMYKHPDRENLGESN